MSARIVHVVRQITAPLAWVSGIGAVLIWLPLLVFGIPRAVVYNTNGNGPFTDSNTGYHETCGTLFDEEWRPEVSLCRPVMLRWVTWALVLFSTMVVSFVVWWWTVRRDRIPI